MYGVETIMSHYTLSWHDQQNEYHEIGEYADDAFEAVRHAREDVPSTGTSFFFRIN